MGVLGDNIIAGASGNIPTVQTVVADGAGTVFGTPTGRAGLSAAFDGNTDGGHTEGAGRGSGTELNCYIGKDWGSGNTKLISGVKVWPPNGDDYAPVGWDSNTGEAAEYVTCVLQGSTDNFSSSVVILGTVFSGVDINDKSEQSQLSGFTVTTAYRYHRLHLVTTGGQWQCCIMEVRFYEEL